MTDLELLLMALAGSLLAALLVERHLARGWRRLARELVAAISRAGGGRGE